MKNRFLIALVTGLVLASCKEVLTPPSPATAMDYYLSNDDSTYSWDVMDQYVLGDLNITVLKMISQQWRGIRWTHEIDIICPAKPDGNEALLFISGGINDYGLPDWRGQDDGIIRMMGQIAKDNNALVAIVSQVPNQPLYNGLAEDALIAFTLYNYREDGDLTWPLLFPMTKTVIKAMDAVQDYARNKLDLKIKRFLVSGASKRGWTTWLAAAQDERITAIAPMVIDILNMAVNVDYQKEAWGDYSVEIQDYVKLGITSAIDSPQGSDLASMIDPFSYREKLDMPKMIFIGTNDRYWPVDAVKNYIGQIPGKNYIHYVPNAGHELGDGTEALQCLSAFFNLTRKKRLMPVCDWKIKYDTSSIILNITAGDNLVRANFWHALSLDRDFRDEIFNFAEIQPVTFKNIDVVVKYPETGFKAFYVELVYRADPVGEYSVTTRMFVTGEKDLYLD